MNQKLTSVVTMMFAATLSMSAIKPGKVLMVGCDNNKIAIIDRNKDNKVIWEYETPAGFDCNDVELTKKGDLLFAYNRGAMLMDIKSKTSIWNFKVKNGEELFTATQLENGNYFLAMCGQPSRIVELNKKGEKVTEYTVELDIKNTHGQFRQIFPMENGNFMVPIMAKGEVCEIDRSGKIVNSMKVKGNLFSVKPYNKDQWIVSCGDAHAYEIIDMKNKTIIERSSSKIDGADLLFVAEIIPMKNKNIMIANWNGHSNDQSQPLVLEINKDKKIVWKLLPNQGIGKVSGIYAY